MSEIMSGMQPMAQPARVTRERLMAANKELKKYKGDKGKLESRLLSDEEWWQGHAWHCMAEQGNPKDPKRPTKWLVNVILGKHADSMDAYPEPVILAREEGDQEEAKRLTSVVPVILEQNHFEEVYARQAWEKNKHGTGCFGIFWDASKLNGLGDVSIIGVDMLNMFWEPGIEDIQDSENLFVVSAVDKEALIREYPQLRDANLESDFALQQYNSEGHETRSDKALVIDWYYHTYEGGVKLLQYCKYVGLEVLYASEDDPAIAGRGWYEDGLYPFVLDTLYPQKESPAGWGYIDLGREAQESIDLLDYSISLNARAGAIPRYFRRTDSPINLNQFLDFTNPVVEVEGGLGEADMVPIPHYPLEALYVQHLNNKIEELKQTCGNQDVSNGISTGVTAASGIAALQETAGRTSRDGNKSSYRAYSKIIEMVIERIRQFYDVPRFFRILGENADFQFIAFDNTGLQMQPNAPIDGQEMGWRKPVFDIQVSAQKQNAYSKMAQNELALQLLNAGVFNPQLADQSMLLLSMMDFPKKDDLIRKLTAYQTMQKELAMWQAMALKLAETYEPGTAEQMAQGIMGQAAAQGNAPDAVQPELEKKGAPGTADAAHMVKAREQSRDITQPD